MSTVTDYGTGPRAEETARRDAQHLWPFLAAVVMFDSAVVGFRIEAMLLGARGYFFPTVWLLVLLVPVLVYGTYWVVVHRPPWVFPGRAGVALAVMLVLAVFSLTFGMTAALALSRLVEDLYLLRAFIDGHLWPFIDTELRPFLGSL